MPNQYLPFRNDRFFRFYSLAAQCVALGMTAIGCSSSNNSLQKDVATPSPNAAPHEASQGGAQAMQPAGPPAPPAKAYDFSWADPSFVNTEALAQLCGSTETSHCGADTPLVDCPGDNFKTPTVKGRILDENGVPMTTAWVSVYKEVLVFPENCSATSGVSFSSDASAVDADGTFSIASNGNSAVQLIKVVFGDEFNFQWVQVGTRDFRALFISKPGQQSVDVGDIICANGADCYRKTDGIRPLLRDDHRFDKNAFWTAAPKPDFGSPWPWGGQLATHAAWSEPVTGGGWQATITVHNNFWKRNYEPSTSGGRFFWSGTGSLTTTTFWADRPDLSQGINEACPTLGWSERDAAGNAITTIGWGDVFRVRKVDAQTGALSWLSEGRLSTAAGFKAAPAIAGVYPWTLAGDPNNAGVVDKNAAWSEQDAQGRFLITIVSRTRYWQFMRPSPSEAPQLLKYGWISDDSEWSKAEWDAGITGDPTLRNNGPTAAWSEVNAQGEWVTTIAYGWAFLKRVYNPTTGGVRFE